MKSRNIILATLLIGVQVLSPIASIAETVDSNQETDQAILSQAAPSATEAALTENTENIANEATPATTTQENVSILPLNDTASAASVETIDSWMPDKNLQNIVGAALGQSDFTQEDMLRLTDLTIVNQEIANLQGLSYAKNLVNLTINNTDLSATANLAEVGTLSNLESVIANGDNLSDLSFINSNSLTSLRTISLSDNLFTNLNGIRGISLPSLEYIDISYNQLNDISIIQDLDAPNVSTIIASHNQISDIAPIANSSLTNLVYLDAGYNLIKDVDAFANSSFTKLESLIVNDNQISDISVMKNLKDRYPNLHVYNVDRNHINSIEFMEGYYLYSSTSAADQSFETTVTKIKPSGAALQQYEIEVPVTSLNYKYDNSVGYYVGTPDPNAETLSLFSISGADKLRLTEDILETNIDENSDYDRVKSFVVEASQSKLPDQLSFSWRGAQGQFTGTAKININWVDAQAPIINASNQTVYTGDVFDSLSTVTAYDQQLDGSAQSDLTDQIKVLSSNVNTNKAGVYTITYSVTNQYGVTANKTISVTVLENKQSINGEDFSMYVGGDTPLAADFKASATGKSGENLPITVDLNNVNLNLAGDYTVFLRSEDGQTKAVKLHILEHKAGEGDSSSNASKQLVKNTNSSQSKTVLPTTNESQGSLTEIIGLLILISVAVAVLLKKKFNTKNNY
ncbi:MULTISPECIES: leucine-rich repeat domain-containing protein [unclassified Enterococcus]|uniref:leucine-rich repeat domain-containing protein n=1 Tax=unclassified Enterococcus TaxID=2608891 RepID=UPI0015562CAC|nr:MULTISPECIES: leucine-rich repeat domain-containing protein [unclassified Enterococcus]MBS7576791.1 DUF5011 domain-containing protein [Enterococcus sp. MMGLQ5-2]MBS7584198.1 DUF5011 domain-containing protein [Enterococcus sp. MMGLQ5-1]NPD12056.1 DUF5011 domain-containing protein [Enterococcus sp. MMGLQ5-1]NPD36628.1 DUF5011 domain-containing protein [Enterococcus sp. MMGLQ5-2]